MRVSHFLRRRARPARHDQPHRPAMDIRQRLAVHGPHDHACSRPSPSRCARRARSRRLAGVARQMQVGGIMRGVFRAGPSARAFLSRSASGTPVHSAQPAPPLVHWLPRAGGGRIRTRPLPPHSSTMRRVNGLVLRFQLAERDLELGVDLAVDGDLPGVGILVSSGICPLLRM